MIATITAQVLLLMNQNLEADYPRSVVSPDFSCILNHTTFIPSRSGLLLLFVFLLLKQKRSYTLVNYVMPFLCDVINASLRFS